MPLNLYRTFRNTINSIPISVFSAVLKNRNILPYYHVVTDDPKPHLKHLGFYREKKHFKSDIDFFLKHYRSIPIKDIKIADDRFFHLSFDDGLSEIYDEIIPVLERDKIDASFFVNTAFIDNKDMFYRHKISVIIDSIKESRYNLNKVSDFFSCEEDTIYGKINHLKDDAAIAELAQLLQIDFKQYLMDVAPYVTTQQLREIKKMGFTIGNHSKNHPNFKEITFLEQQKQLSAVNRFLEKELNIKNFYFAFPFGADHHIKKDFFQFMYEQEHIMHSFGTSGLCIDQYVSHLHRIPMEQSGLTVNEILKAEYFHCILRSFRNKNIVKRRE